MRSESLANSRWFQIGIRVLSIVLVIVITVLIVLFHSKAQGFEKYGYPGIFVLSFLTYATVIVPVPGLLVVSAMGAYFNPILVALAAGLGAALGQLTGYLAGFGSQPVVERVQIYKRMVEWVRKNGPLSILVLSAIPNPIFDITGAAAGALRMPVYKFFFWTWMGETIKMVIFAYFGSYFGTILRFT
jgi:membrane protein DedA with SNARE-associated domain